MERDLSPSVAVVVATVRALKLHGGGPAVAAAGKLDEAYTSENLELLEAGLPNLVRHVENARKFGIPVVVAINAFLADSPNEHDLIRKAALEAGAEAAVVTNHWSEGGAGSVELAKAVTAACVRPSDFSFLYPLDSSI